MNSLYVITIDEVLIYVKCFKFKITLSTLKSGYAESILFVNNLMIIVVFTT